MLRLYHQQENHDEWKSVFIGIKHFGKNYHKSRGRTVLQIYYRKKSANLTRIVIINTIGNAQLLAHQKGGAWLQFHLLELQINSNDVNI